MKRMKDGTYQYNGWVIYATGGYCTIKRFVARKNGQSLWRFKLKEIPATCDAFDDPNGTVDSLYLHPLYN